MATFIAFASLGALQIIAAHLAHPVLWTLDYGTILAGVSFALLFHPLPMFVRSLIASPWVWVLVVGAMMAADMKHYARVVKDPHVMTTGPALTEPGMAILHGRDPYGVRLPGDAPISPGPGWLLLLLPLTAGHVIALVDGLALLFAAAVLGRASRMAGGVLIVLSLLQPMFQSEAANAQDLFVISLVLAALCWLLGTVQLTRANVLLLGAVSGFVATSRLPMILFFAVLVAGLWKRSRAGAVIYGAVTLAVCMALHTGFALWTEASGHWYQPLHVLGRADGGGAVEPIMATVLLLAAAVIAARFLNANPASWILACWLTMTALFAPIGVRELIAAHYSWLWEGDNYIVFPLPLLAAAIAVRAGRYGIGQQTDS